MFALHDRIPSVQMSFMNSVTKESRSNRFSSFLKKNSKLLISGTVYF